MNKKSYSLLILTALLADRNSKRAGLLRKGSFELPRHPCKCIVSNGTMTL